MLLTHNDSRWIFETFLHVKFLDVLGVWGHPESWDNLQVSSTKTVKVMICGVPKMGVPQKGWFIMEKSHLEMDDDWGYPYDSGNPHMDSSIWLLHNILWLSYGEIWDYTWLYYVTILAWYMVTCGWYMWWSKSPRWDMYHAFRPTGRFPSRVTRGQLDPRQQIQQGRCATSAGDGPIIIYIYKCI